MLIALLIIWLLVVLIGKVTCSNDIQREVNGITKADQKMQKTLRKLS